MADVYMLRNVAGPNPYGGFDPGLNRHIEVPRMELIAVSPEKRDQLLRDFPGNWEDFGITSPTAAVTEAENVLDVPLQPRQRAPRNTKPKQPRRTK